MILSRAANMIVGSTTLYHHTHPFHCMIICEMVLRMDHEMHNDVMAEDITGFARCPGASAGMDLKAGTVDYFPVRGAAPVARSERSKFPRSGSSPGIHSDSVLLQ